MERLDSQRDGVKVRELEALGLRVIDRDIVEVELVSRNAEGDSLQVDRLVLPDAHRRPVEHVDRNWHQRVIDVECQILRPRGHSQCPRLQLHSGNRGRLPGLNGDQGN